jgi:hypothetical protein
LTPQKHAMRIDRLFIVSGLTLALMLAAALGA